MYFTFLLIFAPLHFRIRTQGWGRRQVWNSWGWLTQPVFSSADLTLLLSAVLCTFCLVYSLGFLIPSPCHLFLFPVSIISSLPDTCLLNPPWEHSVEYGVCCLLPILFVACFDRMAPQTKDFALKPDIARLQGNCPAVEECSYAC